MRDEEIEREFQAMLADRSEDVVAGPAPFRALAERIVKHRRQRRNRIAGAVLATVVTIAGAGAFAASQGHKAAVGPTTHGTEPAPDPVAFSKLANVMITFDDGTTPISSPKPDAGAKQQNLGGYYGYLEQAAVAYLATMDVNLPAEGKYTVVSTFDKQDMTDAETAANQGLWGAGVLDPAKRPYTDTDVSLAFSAVDPKTGYVKALYNGSNDSANGGTPENDLGTNFDSALDGSIEVGSTFKPITLAAALQTGKFSLDSQEPGTNAGNPGKRLYSPAGCVPKTPDGDPACAWMYYMNQNGNKINWPPGEDDQVGAFEGLTTLTQGMAASLNSVYADLEMDPSVTPKNVLAMANSLGLNNDNTQDLFDVPSLTLGVSEASPLRMAEVYAAFANGGLYHEPIMVEKILDEHGAVVWSAPTEGTQAMSASTASGVTTALRSVVATPEGTAAANKTLGPFAAQTPDVVGKTGTTDYDHAAWFDGYDSDLSTAVVMYRGSALPEAPGSETGPPPVSMNGTAGQVRINGMSFPTTVWTDFMKLIEQGQG